MLVPNRLMSQRRGRRRRRHRRPQIRAGSAGFIASTGKRKISPCEHDGDGHCQAGKMMRNSIPYLPEDILSRIHSFMSMREAARAACVSRAFLRSWRCHPNLIFNKDTIGLKRNAFGENFHGKIGRILRNHSGISLKTFKLDYSGMCGFDGTSYLDSWLQIALKPGIEELTLFLFDTNKQYNFPWSLLSDGVRDSLRGFRVNFSVVETLQMKKLDMGCAIHDARANLPSIMPNLETLVIESVNEVVDATMLPTKFIYLKHLTIRMITGSTISRPYDYFSLVSFINASPSLETLILNAYHPFHGQVTLRMVHESIFTDSQLRHIPEHRHGHLKSVKITGFSSAKSLVELTCYILNNAVSLECLTLDTIYGLRCDQDKYRRCFPMIDGVLTEAPRVLAAIRTYIEDKVPSTVNLTVLEPCSRCHVRRRVQTSSQSDNAVSI
uniref:Uncharacterized protein n=1 Tax=Oryza glumipatula TaxID=40148 RepID=A0A0D9ZM61_9ORYZ